MAVDGVGAASRFYWPVAGYLVALALTAVGRQAGPTKAP